LKTLSLARHRSIREFRGQPTGGRPLEGPFRGLILGFKRIVAAAIALALLVGGLSGFLLVNQVDTLGSQRAWVQHTRSVIETTQRVVSSLQAAEDAERGYLITQDPDYIPPYQQLEAQLTPAEQQLQSLVADNPQRAGQVANLIRQVERRRAGVVRMVQLGQRAISPGPGRW